MVPARGGSKGVPRKNLKPLGGKPLLDYTVKAASGAKLLTEFIVTTEDPEIAEVAMTCGAKVPFIRPPHLAEDDTLTFDVVHHALQEMGVYDYDAVMLLQPTTPFRESCHIDACIELMQDNENVDSVVSVVNVEGNHPLRMKRIVENRLVNYVDTGNEDMRPRQSLPSVYLRNGAIYLSRVNTILHSNTLVGKEVIPFVMGCEQSVNIDSEFDFVLATYLLGKRVD